MTTSYDFDVITGPSTRRSGGDQPAPQPAQPAGQQRPAPSQRG
jgi:hypothetical protein